MIKQDSTKKGPLAIGLAGVAVVTIYAVLFLGAESELAVGVLLAVAGAAALAAQRLGILDAVRGAFRDHEPIMLAGAVLGVIAVAAVFHEDHFALLMLSTAMLYMVACLGLNIQFGYAGIVNFAGASFFGIGCYTAAVLSGHTALPPLLVLPIGGVMAALIGSILILPVLRTRGHYSALVTIAFAVLFKTFLEVNDALGGPQGLSVGSMSLFGWDFNNNIEIGETFFTSFYMNYVLMALALLALAFAFTRRLERSWMGLAMDSIRLDETASACYGLNLARWKVTAFTLGNFLTGTAGALFGMMLGFIAPANFAFGDSLILVSIVLLGGMGSPWGLGLASAIVIILPEKLQLIQEYRFLLFATLVILVLLFRPDGLLPRGMRNYIPGWRVR